MSKSSKKAPSGIGNTKQSPSAKIWCFTLNNWTEEEYSSIVQYFCNKNYKYIIGKEIGEGGTPHLQGHVEIAPKQRITYLKKINNRAHWEKVRNKKASIEYCKKENDYVSNMFIAPKIKFPEMDKPWQQKILKILEEEADDRTIHWFYDEVGGNGKTTFVKYLAINNKAVLCPAKANDAFHRISKCFNEEGEQTKDLDLVVFDIPRSSLDYINYGAIEKIKDGCVVSGKYEGCQCIFKCPHVLIFANEEPDIRKLSSDRWNIIEIV